MSAGPEPQTNANLIEETRKQINRIIEEVTQLSEKDILPADYHAEFLKRVLAALTAPAGAIWGRTAQGNLQLQYQINMREVGFDRESQKDRQSHDELLRQAVNRPQPIHMPPRSSAGESEDGLPAPGNPTDFMVLIAPIVVDNQVAGLVEVWQSPDRHPGAVKGFLQFLVHMADLASRYHRNHMLRQMVGQQQVWTQMEAFARQIHSSLHPVEVAYLVANEGRRLINCDRISVAVRYGKRVMIEAVSGCDVVEKRSNLVQLMRKLAKAVMLWGEKLVFSGEKDDSLPPDVLHALDKYLEESNSKLLVILPLRDERENEKRNPPRSALIMESFDPPESSEQMLAKLEVVGRHASSALYNAVEHRRIPMRFLWMPLARVKEGLGGTARTVAVCVAIGLAALVTAMVLVPYPLKMEATGKLLPEIRRVISAPLNESRVVKINVKPGEVFDQGHVLAKMYNQRLQNQVLQLSAEIEAAARYIAALEAQASKLPDQRPRIDGEIASQRAVLEGKNKELDSLVRANSTAIEEARNGYYWIRAPGFPDLKDPHHQPEWKLLTEDQQEMTNRIVSSSETLMKLGDVGGHWEVELKIPQKHISQILQAFPREYGIEQTTLDKLKQAHVSEKVVQKLSVMLGRDFATEKLFRTALEETLGRDLFREYENVLLQYGKRTQELDVDLLVKSDPTRVFKGKLNRSRVGGQAVPNKEETAEAEPIVFAYVRIHGDDIEQGKRLETEENRPLLVAGTEVRAKVRCGNRPMGYSLFYGVWEFAYEKLVFFFF